MNEFQSKKWKISKNSIDFKIEWLEMLRVTRVTRRVTRIKNNWNDNFLIDFNLIIVCEWIAIKKMRDFKKFNRFQDWVTWDVESDSSDSQSDSYKKQLKWQFFDRFQFNNSVWVNCNQKNERFQKIQSNSRLSDFEMLWVTRVTRKVTHLKNNWKSNLNVNFNLTLI